MLKDKNLKIIILIFLLIWLAIFLLQKINLTTADLGRFIKNGEAIFTGQFRVLTTNFYAYTNPDSYFINHHWATGVLFYIFWKIGGFAGLHFFSVVIGLTTFLIFFYLTKKESGFKITAVVSLILIPLIGYRSEIRPELFTYFFSAIFFMLLWRYKNKSIAQKWLFVLPIMEILWVNIHIYFFLGIAIFGAFLLEQVIVFIKNKNRESRNRLRFLFIVFAFCLIATLVNPFGLRGAIHPLNVYKNYGYRVFEEQSIWFLERLKITDPSFLSFKIVFVLLVLSFVLVLTKNRKNLSLVNLFLAIGFGCMAMVAIRNFTIFGLFALPIMSLNIKTFFDSRKTDIAKINVIVIISAIVFFVFNVMNLGPKITTYFNNLGLGLMSNDNASADFFKAQKIDGPIFNDYDIGGYLIFHLFPQEGVFVDNRPEAYPVGFFEKIYIPMQEKDDIWKEQDRKYNFNVIFFSYRDITPWAQSFLVQRINDSEWAPVFVDQYAIIFLKRNDANKAIIDKFEIPRQNFKVSQSL